MIEEIIEKLEYIENNIIPSEEEINNIFNKINNNEELDSYDLLVIEKIRWCNHILKNKGGKI